MGGREEKRREESLVPPVRIRERERELPEEGGGGRSWVVLRRLLSVGGE